MKSLKILAVALVALAATLALNSTAHAAPADLWLHVHVDEQGDDAARVKVNVPLSLVEKVLTLVPDQEEFRGGKVIFHEEDFTAAELRELWQALKESPDATYVEVEEGTQKVKVAKSGGYLLVHTVEPSEDGERVDVRIPEEVVEALLSGEGDELDVAAAVRALADRGEGELVTVDSHDAKVRIWVDRTAESR